MELHLRPRLLRVLSYIRTGDVLWDIGCDHGYLGMRALLEKNLRGLVCVDRSPSVIDGLKERMALENLPPSVRGHVLSRLPDYAQKDIRIICADAAHLPSQTVSGTVVLAGMGARAILRILDNFVFPNWEENTQLLLLPNAEAPLLEDAFSHRKNNLKQESVEDGKRSFLLYRAMHNKR